MARFTRCVNCGHERLYHDEIGSRECSYTTCSCVGYKTSDELVEEAVRANKWKVTYSKRNTGTRAGGTQYYRDVHEARAAAEAYVADGFEQVAIWALYATLKRENPPIATTYHNTHIFVDPNSR